MNNNIKTGFKISTEWNKGFTGRIDLTNQGKLLSGWELEFKASFDISKIWGAEIVSHKGDTYVIRNSSETETIYKGKTRTIGFNANKINGKVVAPSNFIFNDESMSSPAPVNPAPTSTLTTNAVVSEDWSGGYKLEVDLKAASNSNDWKLDFNLPYNIRETYGVDIVKNGNGSYSINGQDYNQNLKKGESTKAIFIIDDGGNKALIPEFNGSVSSPSPSPSPSPNPVSNSPQKGQFAYGEALQKSFLFFEANRSGDLDKDNRIEWRSDSATRDGSDVGRDLSGGYYDAGDHVKFGLPMSATSTMLAWGGVEYTEAYKKVGQFDELLDAVKWGTDYYIKSNVTENGKTKEFYVQVGDGDLDHAFWGRPEDMTMARPSFKVTTSKPGSDVTAGTASALASASMLFRGTDNAYADKLLTNAKQLFEFADTYKGKYSDSVPKASPFYTSFNGYWDELTEGAAWLYKATGEQKYLDKAEDYFNNHIGGLGDWTWAADDKSYGAAVLLAQESDDPRYKQQVEGWLDKWVNGNSNIKYSPGGLAHRTAWGSLALSSASSFLAGLYNDTVKADAKYTKFATQQVDYILGDNPKNFSYMIGFGDNYAKQPHHRGSAGNSPYGQPNEHILYGALVGGPKSANDYDYKDDRNDWVTNEVATGYNAPLHSALIQQYDDLGGNPLTDQQLDALIGIDANGVGF